MRGIRREVEATELIGTKWQQRLSCGHVVNTPVGANAVGIESIKYRFCKKCMTDAL